MFDLPYGLALRHVTYPYPGCDVAELLSTPQPPAPWRVRLIEDHVMWAHALASRYDRSAHDRQDLNQVALMAVVKAAWAYEPERGFAFASYAAPTVLGELKRYFRDSAWMVRPPRRVQELSADIAVLDEQLGHEFARSPTYEEIAGHVGCDSHDVREALVARFCRRGVSLDVIQAGRGEQADRLLALIDHRFDRVEWRVSLAAALRELGARDRQIIAHTFVDEWSQRQIADELGISQMQVSRDLARILDRLRRRLVAGPASSSGRR